jgi:hypothetical protein
MMKRRVTTDQSGAALKRRHNLFRRKWQPDLYCAAPEDCPVPRFVTAERWDFAGT